MTESKLKRLATSLRESVKGHGYVPTKKECEIYIRESIEGDGFPRSHETRCYQKHGTVYCRIVEEWHYMTVKMGGIEAVRAM